MRGRWPNRATVVAASVDEYVFWHSQQVFAPLLCVDAPTLHAPPMRRCTEFGWMVKPRCVKTARLLGSRDFTHARFYHSAEFCLERPILRNSLPHHSRIMTS